MIEERVDAIERKLEILEPKVEPVRTIQLKLKGIDESPETEECLDKKLESIEGSVGRVG